MPKKLLQHDIELLQIKWFDSLEVVLTDIDTSQINLDMMSNIQTIKDEMRKLLKKLDSKRKANNSDAITQGFTALREKLDDSLKNQVQ